MLRIKELCARALGAFRVSISSQEGDRSRRRITLFENQNGRGSWSREIRKHQIKLLKSRESRGKSSRGQGSDIVSIESFEFLKLPKNSNSRNYKNQTDSNHQIQVTMTTVRPISPQYQHTLDSAISLAKELASKNMADSGESSPKTPNSPDKKRFNFKFKHFGKTFSEASANIRDIESSISHEAKQAYKSLVERGPYNSYSSRDSHRYHSHRQDFHSSLGSPNGSQFVSDDFAPSIGGSTNKSKHVNASTFSVKKSFLS